MRSTSTTDEPSMIVSHHRYVSVRGALVCHKSSIDSYINIESAQNDGPFWSEVRVYQPFSQQPIASVILSDEHRSTRRVWCSDCCLGHFSIPFTVVYSRLDCERHLCPEHQHSSTPAQMFALIQTPWRGTKRRWPPSGDFFLRRPCAAQWCGTQRQGGILSPC